MTVKVAMNVAVAPIALSIPIFLFQKPRNNSVSKVHSDVPRKIAVPCMPRTGIVDRRRKQAPGKFRPAIESASKIYRNWR